MADLVGSCFVFSQVGAGRRSGAKMVEFVKISLKPLNCDTQPKESSSTGTENSADRKGSNANAVYTKDGTTAVCWCVMHYSAVLYSPADTRLAATSDWKNVTK